MKERDDCHSGANRKPEMKAKLMDARPKMPPGHIFSSMKGNEQWNREQ